MKCQENKKLIMEPFKAEQAPYYSEEYIKDRIKDAIRESNCESVIIVSVFTLAISIITLVLIVYKL